MFVAGFLGSPAMNFLTAKVTREDGKLYVANPGLKLRIPPDKAKKLDDYAGREVVFGIRPENLKSTEMVPEHDPEVSLEARVRVREPLGDEQIIHAENGDEELIARLDPRTKVSIDQMIELVAEMEFSHIFDKETEETIV